MSACFDVQNVSFSYDRKCVFQDFSLRLPAGRFYGIIGPNGCGKSTLLDLLVGSRTPDAGRILLNSRKLSKFPRKRLAEEISLVPQNFYVNFPFTAREIVVMGRYPHIPRFSAPSHRDREIVRTAMAATDTERFADRYMTELSGGERQRVIFARALAQDTPILVLDEATSNLDINYGIRLLNIASARVREGKTVISVMQDINLAAAFCDHLIFMQTGGLAAFGPTDQVLTAETIHSVLNVESKVYDEPYTGARHVVFRR